MAPTAFAKRTQTLLHAIATKNALPNGLILFSPSETVRNDSASYLAKAIFCASFDAQTGPCNTCQSCRQIDDNEFVDLRRIQEEKSIKIETVRDIQETCKYGPSNHDNLLIIVENAHKLTPEAANAFLKTLEEPPENTHFILCCPSPKTLLVTIQSRCTQLDLPQLGPPEPVENWPDYTTLCQWSQFERLNQAQALAADKQHLVKGLTLWLANATDKQNIAHITALSEAIQRLRFNVNPRLQLETLFLQL